MVHKHYKSFVIVMRIFFTRELIFKDYLGNETTRYGFMTPFIFIFRSGLHSSLYLGVDDGTPFIFIYIRSRWQDYNHIISYLGIDDRIPFIFIFRSRWQDSIHLYKFRSRWNPWYGLRTLFIFIFRSRWNPMGSGLHLSLYLGVDVKP